MNALFRNDNSRHVRLPLEPKSVQFANRDNHEILFRRISTWLINNRLIQTNIVDTGAWIGDNAIPWAMNTSGLVYAIDPSPDNCRFIREVAALNNLSNVRVIEAALSNTVEPLSTNSNLDHCDFQVGSEGATKLVATTLDLLSLRDVGYVHLDVEGMEFKVIQGMTTLLETDHPIIAFEQHLTTDAVSDLAAYLRDKKYMVFMINEVLPGCRPDCRNFLAFPDTQEYETIVQYLRSYFNDPQLFTRF